MKNYLVLLSVFLFSCQGEPAMPTPEPKAYTTKRIVKSKKEAIETDYGYKFDALNTILSGDLKIRQQPEVKTAHYLIFTDGSYKSVSMGEYVIHEPGDTITETKYQ